jgi:hypothetical protein
MIVSATSRRLPIIAACLTVFVSSGVASGQASSATAPCTTANLSLGLGERVSAMTGEHGVIYTLTNEGKFACRLHGYPGISLYDHKAQLLLFRYTRSKSQYMTRSAPTTVTLRPGNRAYFLVAKYRCDIGIARDSATIRVYPPNSRQQLIGRASPSPSGGGFSYCKGGAKDPGQIVDVSAVRASPHFSS